MKRTVLAMALTIAAPTFATAKTVPSSVPSGTAANLPAFLPAGIASSLSANLVSNGSFETGDFSGWEQLGDLSFTDVDCVNGVSTDGQCGAVFGPVDPAGGFILQTIATIPGQAYVFSYDLSNLDFGPNAFGAIWDGAFIVLEGDLEPFPYSTFTGIFTATGTATQIGFGFFHEPAFFLLDNVSVAVIPEPGTWAMLIAGFGLVGLAARRRRTAITA